MPDSPRNRPHIFLAGGGQKEPFTSPKSGPREQVPQRDRKRHANTLRKSLQEAYRESDALLGAREATLASGPPGRYLEFSLSSKELTALGSLENRLKGIELLSVRPSEEEGLHIATVFCPVSAGDYFGKKIESYRDEDTKAGKPKNQGLVARLDNVRVASVRSLFTDEPALFPLAGGAIWWEVWSRSAAIGHLVDTAEALNLPIKSKLQFPEREVLLVRATIPELSKLIWNSDAVAELKLARDTPASFLGLSGREQALWTQALVERVEVAPPEDGLAVCILDGGMNRSHPLLAPFLENQDLHAHDPAWGTADEDGHGTGMAGLALFGDLTPHLDSDQSVQIRHTLESVKVLPPNGGANDPNSYGFITAEAVARVESVAPERDRVICMAITSDGRKGVGAPTAWSAAVDHLCFGEGNQQRLVVLSAGNIRDQLSRSGYPARNDIEGVEDPAQAWNALVAGAYTQKTEILDPTYANWQVIAPSGQLCPTSRTSVPWSGKWPVKPDVVVEGGNYADDGQGLADCIDDLAVLTTDHRLPPFFASFSDTSAAAAEVARIAASLKAYRPAAWPETTRALLVHSAEWTEAMKAPGWFNASAEDKRLMLRRYGYGVPSLSRAYASAANDLTLVIEDELVPFDKIPKKGIRTREMNIHRFPWPRRELEALGGTNVELRVSLSYFVEPNPGERGWTAKHRYASHGLRFEVKRPLETDDLFRKRINRAAWDDGNRPNLGFTGEDGWLLTRRLRDVGSLHSDYWQGTGAELATRDAIGVYPTTGWWQERARLERWGQPVRYALVVTIRAPGADIDIHTPVLNALTISSATIV